MMLIKMVISVIKKIIVAFLFIYGLDMMVSSLNIFIPINLFSVSVVTCLGVSGLISLVALFFIVK